MTEEQKKLEKALLDFVEKETKEPSSDETIRILPQMAHDLITLWHLTQG